MFMWSSKNGVTHSEALIYTKIRRNILQESLALISLMSTQSEVIECRDFENAVLINLVEYKKTQKVTECQQ